MFKACYEPFVFVNTKYKNRLHYNLNNTNYSYTHRQFGALKVIYRMFFSMTLCWNLCRF